MKIELVACEAIWRLAARLKPEAEMTFHLKGASVTIRKLADGALHITPSTAELRTYRAGSPPVEHWGPPLWDELHRRPFIAGLDLSKEYNWLVKNYARRVKSGCGDCRKHFLAWIKQTPPDLSSLEAYFIWTWRTHNQVNDRRKVPLWTLDQARERWVSGTHPS